METLGTHSNQNNPEKNEVRGLGLLDVKTHHKARAVNSE